MLLQRTFEERTWALYRQGRISGSMDDRSIRLAGSFFRSS